MNTILIVSITTFVVVVLVTVLIFLYISSKVKSLALKERLVQKPHLFVSKGTDQIDNQSGHLKQFFTKIVSAFGDFAQPKSAEDYSRIRKRLLNVGYRGRNAVKIFIGIKCVCILAPPAALFFSSFFIPIHVSPLRLMTYYILLASVGYFLPNLWLKIEIADRQKKLLNSFPDAVDMLVVCVEAGIGLDAAMERVGSEMAFENKVLSEELKLYNSEMRVGKPRKQALRDLAMRTGLEEVRTLTTLLIQTEKFGTSIAKSLRTHSDFLRVQRYQRAEEKAAKLSVQLVIPLIFCMLPSIFIVILGPAAINAIRINQ
jgi:tight adherence protein C